MSSLPLRDLRIVDFSWSIPGPYATMLLADLGADVVRVEKESDDEIFRHMGPMDGESSHAHRYFNRNKSAVALDLKSVSGRKRALDLLADADVLVEQFRPGVMERLGLGYEKLRSLNPRLVYCSISGFGQTGTYAGRAGHDINYLALSGIAHGMGRDPGRPSGPFALPIADLAGGALHSVIGILVALRHRERTGVGQQVDISMTHAMWALNGFLGAAALNGSPDCQPGDTALNGGSFYGHYETSDGRFMAVGGLEPKFREGLCRALAREDLLPLALSEERRDQDNFRRALECIFRERTCNEWTEFFRQRDLCVEPVLTVSEAAAHDWAITPPAIVDVDSEQGPRRQFAHPIRYSEIEPRYDFTGRDAVGARRARETHG